jgi:hypothetical protein
LIDMRFSTVALRALLVVLGIGVLLAYAVLYVFSADMAASYPPLAPLQVPLFMAAVVAGVPAAVALGALWRFAALVSRGEGFSPSTVRLLRLMRNCFGALAVYLLVAFVATTIAMAPGQSPGVVLAWCASEVIAVFLFTFAAVMVGLFDNAVEMRLENELTV